MKVAVAGTAGLAQHITRAAAEEGHEVFMLSRFVAPSLSPHQDAGLTKTSNQQRPQLAEKGFRVIQVDYSNPASLHATLIGVDTVISTVSGAPQLALIDSCLTACVRRFAPAEFEGVPYERPMIEQGRKKIDTLNRLREVREKLQSTAFCCGIFYEWFGPGGLSRSGVSAGTILETMPTGRVFVGDEACYMLDFRNERATVPAYTEKGGDVYACFTAAADVGRFVAKCLNMETWPEQLRMRGERLKLLDFVRIAEAVRDSEELHEQTIDAEEAEDWKQVSKLEALIAAQRGELDFLRANANECLPEVKTLSLKQWLSKAWAHEA
ncbi:NAD(P)-binding protein [Tuber magnatum]|uniref:NAD(P)-binding protein n=1 Tax=Tuber magnatum TaxID=42249 RepID=A0A317SUL7_9PEZI|nr:NAD(P)-binding protein [Tuber magnatum]